MTPISEKITDMIDMLPAQEQQLAYEFIKRLVLAWDPDFTKLTPAEAQALSEADAEYARNDTISLEDFERNLGMSV